MWVEYSRVFTRLFVGILGHVKIICAELCARHVLVVLHTCAFVCLHVSALFLFVIFFLFSLFVCELCFYVVCLFVSFLQLFACLLVFCKYSSKTLKEDETRWDGNENQHCEQSIVIIGIYFATLLCVSPSMNIV